METVKKAGQLLKSIVLSGFILLILNGSIAAPNDAYLTLDSNRSTHVSLAATDLLSITTNTERFYEENIQRLLTAPSKLSFGDYLAVAKVTEAHRGHLITKYISCTSFMVPRFDQQDIVFPFHHFW